MLFQLFSCFCPPFIIKMLESEVPVYKTNSQCYILAPSIPYPTKTMLENSYLCLSFWNHGALVSAVVNYKPM